MVVGILKWIHLDRKARSIDEGANFLTIIRAVYGGSWLHLNLPAIVCMLFVPVVAVVAGHPWYMVPGIAIFFAFPCNGLGLMVQRPEYLVMGWFTLVTGLLSLFFMESMPFAWSGIIWGGAFFIFGVVGLAVKDRSAPV